MLSSQMFLAKKQILNFLARIFVKYYVVVELIYTARVPIVVCFIPTLLQRETVRPLREPLPTDVQATAYRTSFDPSSLAPALVILISDFFVDSLISLCITTSYVYITSHYVDPS